MKNQRLLLIVCVVLGLCFVGALSGAVAKSRENAAQRAEIAALRNDITTLTAEVTRLIEQRPVTQTIDFDALRMPMDGAASNSADNVEIYAAELETVQRLLADRDREIEQLRARIAEAGSAPRERRPPEGDAQSPATFGDRMRERMEQWQKENPEEYAQMQQQRQERRLQMANASRERTDFFKAVSTEGLDDEYKQNHEALVAKLQFADDAMTRILADPDSEESQQLRRELYGSYREIGGMMDKERTVLLNDFARQLGYNQTEAGQIVEYVDHITEMTTFRPPRMGGGNRGGRGGN